MGGAHLTLAVVVLAVAGFWILDYLAPPQAHEEIHTRPAEDGSLLAVRFYRNGGNSTEHGKHARRGVRVNLAKYNDLFAFLPKVAGKLGFQEHEFVQLFNSQGEEIDDLKGAQHGDVYYLVREGDAWFWPPVHVGHRTPLAGVTSADGTNILEMETLSVSPRVFLIHNFLSADEAARVIELATPKIKRSGVTREGSETHSADFSEVRTSSHMWLPDNADVAQVLNKRVAQLSKVDSSQGDQLQVINYGVGQHYHAHYDYFDPQLFPDNPNLKGGKRNRMITVLFYLNDVEEGGETVFPRGGENGYGEGQISDYGDCSRGVVVSPRPGSAIMFYNMDADSHMQGGLDGMSLHGGCDVLAGEKWAANKWIYNLPS